jgi:pre-mRNA-processing factor 39
MYLSPLLWSKSSANHKYRPPSVSPFAKDKLGAKENGVSGPELDDTARLKSEARYLSYYQLFQEPDPNAQGPAEFN